MVGGLEQLPADVLAREIPDGKVACLVEKLDPSRVHHALSPHQPAYPPGRTLEVEHVLGPATLEVEDPAGVARERPVAHTQ